MGNPANPTTVGIPFASGDGRYWSRYPQGDAPVSLNPFEDFPDPGFLPFVPGGGGFAMNHGYAFRNGSSAWTGSDIPTVYLINADDGTGLTLMAGKSKIYTGGSAAAAEHMTSGDYTKQKIILYMKGGVYDFNSTYSHAGGVRGKNAIACGFACPGDVIFKGYIYSGYGCENAAILGVRFGTDIAEPTKSGIQGSERPGITAQGTSTLAASKFLVAFCEQFFTVDQGPLLLGNVGSASENSPLVEVGYYRNAMGVSLQNSIHEWADGDATLGGAYPGGYYSAHGYGPMVWYDVDKCSFIGNFLFCMGARNPAIHARVTCFVNNVIFNHGGNGYSVCTPGGGPGPSDGPGGTPVNNFYSEGIGIGSHPSDSDPKPFKVLIARNLCIGGPNGFNKMISSQFWDADVVDNPETASSEFRIIDNYQHGADSGGTWPQTYGDWRDFVVTIPSAGAAGWVKSTRVTEAEAPGVGADAANCFDIGAHDFDNFKDFLDRIRYSCGLHPKDRGAAVDIVGTAIGWAKNYLDGTTPNGGSFDTYAEVTGSGFPAPSSVTMDWTNSTMVDTYWDGDPIPLDESTMHQIQASGRTLLEEWVWRRWAQRYGFPS